MQNLECLAFELGLVNVAINIKSPYINVSQRQARMNAHE